MARGAKSRPPAMDNSRSTRSDGAKWSPSERQSPRGGTRSGRQPLDLLAQARDLSQSAQDGHIPQRFQHRLPTGQLARTADPVQEYSVARGRIGQAVFVERHRVEHDQLGQIEPAAQEIEISADTLRGRPIAVESPLDQRQIARSTRRTRTVPGRSRETSANYRDSGRRRFRRATRHAAAQNSRGTESVVYAGRAARGRRTMPITRATNRCEVLAYRRQVAADVTCSKMKRRGNRPSAADRFAVCSVRGGDDVDLLASPSDSNPWDILSRWQGRVKRRGENRMDFPSAPKGSGVHRIGCFEVRDAVGEMAARPRQLFRRRADIPRETSK